MPMPIASGGRETVLHQWGISEAMRAGRGWIPQRCGNPICSLAWEEDSVPLLSAEGRPRGLEEEGVGLQGLPCSSHTAGRGRQRCPHRH